jgi:glycosyltransferase involved in cell wall biosynthesis
LKILYFLRDKGACGYYRVDLPLTKLALVSNGEHSIHKFSPGDSLDALNKFIEEADVIVIPRLAEEPFVVLVEEMKKNGKLIVIDHDDNMFSVSPFSPHYDCCGIEDVVVKMPDGEKMWLWKDGHNINLENNKKLRENMKRGLAAADLVTVTQPILADVYKKYNDNVVCLPNCVDLELWKPHKIARANPDEIRMGWAGGHSHYEDWCVLSPVLPKVMEKYPHLKFVVSGAWFEGVLKTIPDWQKRVELNPWVDISAYPYKSILNDMDFFVIPLQDTEFNRCKSNIKWVEQAAIEVPAVTSLVSPYKEIATEDNGIFIEKNDPESWYEGICYMIENAEGRKKMGKAARATVEQHFDSNKEAHRWAEAYASAMVRKAEGVRG